ncbi:M16 family metallopeptidase [bacterium]
MSIFSTDGDYHRTILKNGIRIVSEKMNSGRSVSFGVWVTTGSRNENQKNNGVSHLLEHMVFKGTKTRNAFEIASSLESLGGHLNAFTDREFTCYYALVLDDNILNAVEVITDLIQNAVFNTQELEKEKSVIFEEIQNMEDSPEDLIQDWFYQNIFDDHSLGNPILGTKYSIQHIDRKTLKEYWKQKYTANNIIIACSGLVDHNYLVACVEKNINKLKEGSRFIPHSVKLSERTSVMKNAPIQQCHIYTGIPTFEYTNPQKFALVLLNQILGGGMSSRLFQLLREEEGLVYSIYSFLDFWSDIGLFNVYTGTSSKNSDDALESIYRVFSNLCQNGISDSELQNAQSYLTRSLILSSEDSSNRMNRLAKMEIYGQSYKPLSNIIERIQAVKKEEIHSVADLILSKRQRFITRIQPNTLYVGG